MALAEEHAGGQVAAERRARHKPLFTVPIIAVVLFLVAPCALFVFTSDVALPRIRIEYRRHDSDLSRDVPASTPANHAPPPVPEAAVAVPRDEKRRDVPALAELQPNSWPGQPKE
jgi:xyloglucan 6-xylosyltransferase